MNCGIGNRMRELLPQYLILGCLDPVESGAVPETLPQ